MFLLEIEGRDFGLKPMNCPGHCLLYSLTPHSYRELPLRLAEAGNLHRNELSGVLHGLLRVRHFVQDDAHIFCSDEQVHDELVGCLDYAFFLYDLLGITLRCELSTRPGEPARHGRGVGSSRGRTRPRARGAWRRGIGQRG